MEKALERYESGSSSIGDAVEILRFGDIEFVSLVNIDQPNSHLNYTDSNLDTPKSNIYDLIEKQEFIITRLEEAGLLSSDETTEVRGWLQYFRKIYKRSRMQSRY